MKDFLKELLDEINLPKQLIDKGEKFAVTIFGPSVKEVSLLFADKIRYKRFKNQVEILKKAFKIIDENHLEARELNLKTLVPLIEYSSLEDDKYLQDKWSQLLANICSSPETGLEPKLVKTLSSLSALEAQVIDFIYECFLIERRSHFERIKKGLYSKYNSELDVKLDYITIKILSIKNKFSINDEFTGICINNLVSLGLLKYEEPQVKQESWSNTFDVKDSESGPYVEVDLDISYNQSEDIHLTAYGQYFISQCKIETENK